MNDDTFVESSFRFFLNNWFDVMLVFAFLLLFFSIIYINKAKAAHGDPTLFENKVKDQLYHRTITIKSKSPFMDVTDSLKHGLSLVDQAKNETERIKEMIEKEKIENDALNERNDAMNELADLRVGKAEDESDRLGTEAEKRKELAAARSERESFSNLDGVHLRKPRERSASHFPLQNAGLVHSDLFYYKN